MSRWIALALFCEGSTDASFLKILAYREAFERIRHLSASVTLQEQVIELNAKTNDDRARSICDSQNFADIFFIHSDLGRADENIIAPIRGAAREICAFDPIRVVAIIPRREMESWALSQPSAIARALGYSSCPDEVTEIVGSGRVEDIPDPKEVLNRCLNWLAGERRIRGSKLHAALEQIARELDLKEIGRLVSYRAFREALDQSLRFVLRHDLPAT